MGGGRLWVAGKQVMSSEWAAVLTSKILVTRKTGEEECLLKYELKTPSELIPHSSSIPELVTTLSRLSAHQLT